MTPSALMARASLGPAQPFGHDVRSTTPPDAGQRVATIIPPAVRSLQPTMSPAALTPHAQLRSPPNDGSWTGDSLNDGQAIARGWSLPTKAIPTMRPALL